MDRCSTVIGVCDMQSVSMLSLVAMFTPRVWFLSHLKSFQYFSVALWVIICLLMQIFEGHHSLVSKMSEHLQHIEFCCVFPCLPKIQLDSRKVRICELMVLQAPCVRLFATLTSLVIYFEYQDKGLIPLFHHYWLVSMLLTHW